jgi:hypothetical protein
MKRVPLYLFALTTLLSSAARAEVSYVLVPTITPGVTVTKVEMGRKDLSLSSVQTTFVAEGQSGLGATPKNLKVYVGPSTSKVNPLLDLTSVVTSGGMAMIEPVAGLDAVEVSFEVEQNPVRTAWKLPMLSASDFFTPGSTAYVQNLVKATDAASNLQLFNIAHQTATCKVTVLRPKGTPIEERTGIKVPALGVVRIPDILRAVQTGTAAGINAAVTCDAPFYALGALPATDRWQSRVEFPVSQLPGATTAVTLDSRPGLFFKLTRDNSDLHIPVNLDPNTTYHKLSIDFEAAVADPPGFVVFRNVIGMFRSGGRRFNKTLFFGSFENFDKSKYVLDMGSPFIETTLKRNFPLVGGKTYHFSITLDNDQQSLRYLITDLRGGVVTDILGGLYNNFNVVDGNAPIIELGLPGVADNAYYPPYGWRFSNLKIVATK